MNKLARISLMLVSSLLLSVPAVRAADTPMDEFEPVIPGRTLVYPRDHGAHPSFKTEWWYFTGHLTPAQEMAPRFGFELVFFRVGVNRNPQSRSAWKVGSLYLAHFAVTDDNGKSFFNTEQMKRGSFGDAGASVETLDSWNGSWRARLEDGKIHLSAAAEGRELDLRLTPKKPLVLHGENGFSKKGAGPGEASYYSSFTRLEGGGTLKTPAEQLRIDSASVWMDQEFTSSESGEAKVGWDWFALQLTDGSELMLYQLRDRENRPTAFSAGTVVAPDGTARHLGAADFSVEVTKRWRSPESGVNYPAAWNLKVPSLGRAFHVAPTVSGQELRTEGSTGVSYWEGRCKVSSPDGAPQGSAYVELVGYHPGG